MLSSYRCPRVAPARLSWTPVAAKAGSEPMRASAGLQSHHFQYAKASGVEDP
jgi:hypothetical protein